MNFINNIDFIATIHGRKLHRFPEITNLIDTAVRGRIDLKNIH